MVLVLGLFLYMLAILGLVLVWRGSAARRRRAAVPGFLQALLVAAAVVLLFRPHEDLFGGDDPGSYVNSAVTYARRDRLFYEDEMLARVPEAVRPAFYYYGHGSAVKTKSHVLRIRDDRGALMGPWFQPAYPLLMSLVARLGPAPWVLYVAPFFTLCGALVLGVLAGQLLRDSRAGPIAFALYAFNPLVAWHGRCARAELVALFFVLTALTLLYRVRAGPRRWAEAVVGGLCLAAAPFFHATAWFAAIPAVLVAGVLLLAGRREAVCFPLAAFAGGMLFAWEMSRVVDWYGLRPVAARIVAGWLPMVLAAGLGLVALTWAGVRLSGRRTGTRPAGWWIRRLRFAGPAFAVCTVLLFVAEYRCHTWPGPTTYPLALLEPANMRGVVTMLSLPLVLLALLGWATLFLRRTGRPMLLVHGLTVLPGIALGHRVYHYLYGSRYFLLFVVPAVALSLTSLATLWPRRDRGCKRWLPLCCTGLMLGLGVYGRLPLYGITEYRGLARFLGSFIRPVQEKSGIVLAEYSRIAAPLEHFFGVPTLALDNERIDDYSAAEAAWAGILREEPGRAAFFVTPFPEIPISDRFVFEPVSVRVYEGVRLRSRTRALPSAARSVRKRMSLYRMRLRTPSAGGDAAGLPHAFRFGAGNMGLRRFSRTHQNELVLTGVRLPAEMTRPIPFVPAISESGPVEILLFLWSSPSGDELRIDATSGGVDRPMRTTRLIDGWWLARVGLPDAKDMRTLAVTASREAFLSEWQTVANGRAVKRYVQPSTEEPDREPIGKTPVRWARDGSRFLLPPTPGGVLYLCMFMAAPAQAGPAVLSLKMADAADRKALAPGEWGWSVWPVRTAARGAPWWVTLRTSRPFDPDKRGYPSDLAALAAYATLVPGAAADR